ncbi:MAG TPA: signal recognition particle-docking protein FtsY [Candidatus Nitrosotenuis sp.]|nr:signal recognition particle-docking protein FtsY [Candidatus Nitrosotenuis sp.]
MDKFTSWLRGKPPAEAPQAPAPQPQAPEAEPRKSWISGAWEATRKLALTPVDPWFEKMAQGLQRTSRQLVGSMVSVFRLHKRIDESLWEELEDVLLASDVGPAATARILDELRAAAKNKHLTEPAQLVGELKEALARIFDFEKGREALNLEPGRINVILMVGVNGTGKTTSTAKIAHRLKQQGHRVLLAAADTFRAAAIEQLEVWGNRVGVDVIRQREGADPAAVVVDALAAAGSRGCDVVLVDTAGRLHNKANLMEELKKIRRVASARVEGAPHEVLLVLDATTGQNAVQQARVFRELVDVTGLVLCKLDGTAKGGVVLAIAQELQIPVKFIGVGEGVEDLREFDPQAFVEALFSLPEAGQEAAAAPG